MKGPGCPARRRRGVSRPPRRLPRGPVTPGPREGVSGPRLPWQSSTSGGLEATGTGLSPSGGQSPTWRQESQVQASGLQGQVRLSTAERRKAVTSRERGVQHVLGVTAAPSLSACDRRLGAAAVWPGGEAPRARPHGGLRAGCGLPGRAQTTDRRRPGVAGRLGTRRASRPEEAAVPRRLPGGGSPVDGPQWSTDVGFFTLEL